MWHAVCKFITIKVKLDPNQPNNQATTLCNTKKQQRKQQIQSKQHKRSENKCKNININRKRKKQEP